ncbi:MAG: RNA polymerase sigma factor [Caulobacter sp.]
MPPLDTALTAPAPPPPEVQPPFTDAYLAHRAWLTDLLRGLYGPDAAADLVQDVYLKIHGFQPSRPVKRPRSLLARIARNLAIDRFRKQARLSIIAPEHPAIIERKDEAAQEQAVFFTEMLLALPEHLRDVLILNHVRGLTYPEIARLRGISVKAVEKRMQKAIARCADLVRG